MAILGGILVVVSILALASATPYALNQATEALLGAPIPASWGGPLYAASLTAWIAAYAAWKMRLPRQRRVCRARWGQP